MELAQLTEKVLANFAGSTGFFSEKTFS